MVDNDFDDIEEELERHWKERGEDSNVDSLISPPWETFILPTLKVRAHSNNTPKREYRDQLIRSRHVTVALWEALHSNVHFAADDEKPKDFWRHQSFNIFRTNDPKRGIAINKADLIRVAAEYLSQPEIRTNQFDWLLLDTIVFAELDAFADHVLFTKAGTGINWAASFANSNPLKYYGCSIVIAIIGFALRYLAPPAFAYFLAIKGHENASVVIIGVWVLYLLLRLIGLPSRWRARKKAEKLLQHLIEVYGILGDGTISPRKLKESLDKAAAAGVVLDGAVFSLVDRMIARDSTAYIPTQLC